MLLVYYGLHISTYRFIDSYLSILYLFLLHVIFILNVAINFFEKTKSYLKKFLLYLQFTLL